MDSFVPVSIIISRSLLGYYVEAMHASFKENLGTFILEHVSETRINLQTEIIILPFLSEIYNWPF